MKIRLDLIKPSPRPVRSSWDEGKMQELTQSIQEQGLIVPIKVRPDNGGYEIVYGHRRVEACRQAGLGEVEAIVEGVDDTKALIQALIENIQREEMEPLDLAYSLKALQDETGWSQHEMDRRGIMPRRNTSVLLGLLREDKTVQDLVSRSRGGAGEHTAEGRKGRITTYHVTETRETGIDQEDRKQVLLKAANEGLSTPQTRQVAEAIKAAPTPHAKKKLLEWEYSSTLHDPEMVKERAQRVGAHDPLYREDKPAPQREWDNTPEVKAMVEGVIEAARQWQKLLAEIRKMTAVDKLSPEAKQFMAHRVRQLASLLNDWLNELEGESDG